IVASWGRKCPGPSISENTDGLRVGGQYRRKSNVPSLVSVRGIVSHHWCQ
ncbi:unnamed protein product, partial [Staurois parvus]